MPDRLRTALEEIADLRRTYRHWGHAYLADEAILIARNALALEDAVTVPKPEEIAA